MASVQNLSDVVSDLAQAATSGGRGLNFRLQIKLENGGNLNDEQIAELNGNLKEVLAEIQL